MPRVYPAEPYQSCNMGSFGKASHMLLRQFNFPNSYEEDELLKHWDHDHIYSHDFKHASYCFQKHTGSGDGGFEYWLQASNTTHNQVLAFLVEVLKADSSIKWTGYRVCGTVNVSNGYPVYHFAIFAKRPGSTTEVYTDEPAPNVLTGPRRR